MQDSAMPASEREILTRRISELERQLRYDELTEVLTKRAFYEHLKAVGRTGDCMLFIDLDDFKSVNDGYGHLAGDALLKMVARKLREAISENSAIGRLAGDEFLVHIPKKAEGNCDAEVNRILENVVEAEIEVEDYKVSRSASIGISTLDESAEPDEAVILANSALRRAKREGKNRAVRRSPKFDSLSGRPTIEQVKLALQREEIGYFVQPVHNLKQGGIWGYEALIRWRRPNGEVLGPAQFLELMTKAYNTNTRPPTRAANEVARWVTKETDACLSFNVSEAFLQRIALDGIDWLEDLLDNVPTDRIIFEIVETTALSDEDNLAVAFRRLRDVGIRLALDDFGIGQSTLSRLQRIPVDFVKLDKKFLRAATVSERGHKIFKGIVDLVHSGGAEAVIEGIESKDDLEIARQSGADYAQGFFLGRPEPVT